MDLLLCILHEYVLEDYLEATIDSKCSQLYVDSYMCAIHLRTLYLCSRSCIGYWFVSEFNLVMVMTFKVPHSMKPGYLRDCLYPITTTHPIKSSRKGRFGYHQPRSIVWWTQEESRFCHTTCFVEHDSLEMRLALSMLVYCKALKTWFYQQALGFRSVVESVQWLY